MISELDTKDDGLELFSINHQPYIFLVYEILGVLVCPFLYVVIDETRGFPCFIEVPLVCPLSPTAASATHRF